MDLYLIASKRTGISYVLGEIFPGAQLMKWLPIDTPLKGLVEKAVEYIWLYYGDGGNRCKPLPFKEVKEAMA